MASRTTYTSTRTESSEYTRTKTPTTKSTPATVMDLRSHAKIITDPTVYQVSRMVKLTLDRTTFTMSTKSWATQLMFQALAQWILLIWSSFRDQAMNSSHFRKELFLIGVLIPIRMRLLISLWIQSLLLITTVNLNELVIPESQSKAKLRKTCKCLFISVNIIVTSEYLLHP